MEQPNDITEIFGSNVFNQKTMQARLPKDIFKLLKASIDKGATLAPDIADVVANAMKDWAIEKGATHYTHWFQPLTGSTAEKHDSFISPTPGGSVIMEFSGQQLIQGEPDASSFPSGGIRETFEARGYTAWDCTSPAFLKEDAGGNVTLCIPTAFHSYTGEALDKKTPILRSQEAVSKQAIRVLRALGNNTANRVTCSVGPEQEYFLIDKELYEQRLDLIMTGRTLFGSPSPKGQELDDQYFGAIKDRVSLFMHDLDIELWKMGITSKTKHNEVAPAQFEMAPIYATVNVAVDHNQLVMETMKKVALRQGLVCLLHEKPYAGINGSGKHNNWSMVTDEGLNLLDPGHTPHENVIFLVTLAAMIKALDKHALLLRASAANSGNDHRLGANEAPPAIISIFMGTELSRILEDLAKGQDSKTSSSHSVMNLGVDTLPPLAKDNTDRNRTSPFAFTGNKFEFRMVASSSSISGPNVVLNTIAAEALDDIATQLEKATDKNAESTKIIASIYKEHGRVVFNGNNYGDEWLKEAEKRGLPNAKTTVDALKAFLDPKTLDLFEKYKVLSKVEMHSRYDIYSEQYARQLLIEAKTAVQMTKSQFIPAASMYAGELAKSIHYQKSVGGVTKSQESTLKQIGTLIDQADTESQKLEKVIDKGEAIDDGAKQSLHCKDEIIPLLGTVRAAVDELENIVDLEFWPVPNYSTLLFNL